MSRLCFKKWLLEICPMEEKNNNNNENSDSSHSYLYILTVRIENLRSEAESSAGKKKIQCASI